MNVITKAVIPAAGRGLRLFPATKVVPKQLFPIVDHDGVAKPVIQMIVEEAIESGIQEICIVVAPEDKDMFHTFFCGDMPKDLLARIRRIDAASAAFDNLRSYGKRIHYVIQDNPQGFGHAIYCARHFVGDEPFLLLLGDHIHASDGNERCASQLLHAFEKWDASMCSVCPTPEDMLSGFGTIQGTLIHERPEVYEVTDIKEKPSAQYARKHFVVPHLSRGTYLCFFGQHVLTPGIFESLKHHIDNDIRENGEIQLTNALDLLRVQEGRFYALVTEGKRFDVGIPRGFAETIARLADL